MFKAIGVAAFVAALAVGASVYFGWADVDANAALTNKGQAEIQGVRNTVADTIRGDKSGK